MELLQTLIEMVKEDCEEFNETNSKHTLHNAVKNNKFSVRNSANRSVLAGSVLLQPTVVECASPFEGLTARCVRVSACVIIDHFTGIITVVLLRVFKPLLLKFSCQICSSDCYIFL